MTPEFRRRAFVVVACTALGLGATLWLGPAVIDTLTPHSERIAPPPALRDFSLTDTSGQKVSLQNYRGQWVLLFFGFTNCPDACPMAMVNVSATLDELGALAQHVQPVFVTIDPERDTPALLKDYLANFGDNIAGLSGTAEETAEIAKAYGVYYKKRPLSDGDYTMDHSTALYLVSPDGVYVRPYVPDMPPAELAQDLTKHITGASP